MGNSPKRRQNNNRKSCHAGGPRKAWLAEIKNKRCLERSGPERYNPKNCRLEAVEEIRKVYGIKPDEKILLFLGRLIWVKGVTNLVQAMPMILEEYPNTKLVILGKGEQQNNIVETANKLGISNKVVCRFADLSLYLKKNAFCIMQPRMCVSFHPPMNHLA
jgi:glycosyltransferase involved in cell wall biosynthesis